MLSDLPEFASPGTHIDLRIYGKWGLHVSFIHFITAQDIIVAYLIDYWKAFINPYYMYTTNPCIHATYVVALLSLINCFEGGGPSLLNRNSSTKMCAQGENCMQNSYVSDLKLGQAPEVY